MQNTHCYFVNNLLHASMNFTVQGTSATIKAFHMVRPIVVLSLSVDSFSSEKKAISEAIESEAIVLYMTSDAAAVQSANFKRHGHVTSLLSNSIVSGAVGSRWPGKINGKMYL